MLSKSIADQQVINKLKGFHSFNDMIKYFETVSKDISDITYWNLLSVLLDKTDVGLIYEHAEKFSVFLSAPRDFKNKYFMSKNELNVYKALPYSLKIYSVVKEKSKPLFYYYTNFEKAKAVANQLKTLHIYEHEVKKKDIMGCFEGNRIICIETPTFIREHIIVPDSSISIAPHIEGDKGVICMPLKKNIPIGKKGWSVTKCSNCKNDCWETPLLRITLKQQGLPALCTECALKINQN